MPYGFPSAKVSELLKALSESPSADSSGTCFPDVEDLCVVDPVRFQGGLEEGRILLFELSSHALRKEQPLKAQVREGSPVWPEK